MNSVMWQLENLINKTVLKIDRCMLSVGRKPQADLSTESIRISREHATIYFLSNGDLSITDHKSSNGTFVNNKRITVATLKDGDILSIGGTEKNVKSPDFGAPFLYKVVRIDNSCSVSDQTEESRNNVSIDYRKTGTIDVKDADTNSDISVEAEATTSSDILDNEKNSTGVKEDKPIEKEANRFTITQNDCIIISDGEDDDISFSQIFQINEKIKQEPTDLGEFNPYQEIKEELEFLDHCDNTKKVTVDLTDDMDHFENTLDLLDVLGPELNSSNVTENITDKDQNKPIKELKITLENTLINTKDVSSSKAQAKVTINQTSKYLVPPIVEPHDTKLRKEKKEPAKRKSVDEKKTEVKKCSKRRRNSTSNEVLSKPEKEEVKKIRKQKLKEIADKKDAKVDHFKTGKYPANEESICAESNDNNLSVIKAPEKLKFSNIKYSSTDQHSTSSRSSRRSNSKSAPTTAESSTSYQLKPITFGAPPTNKNTEDHKFLAPVVPKVRRLDPRLKKQTNQNVQDTTVSSIAKDKTIDLRNKKQKVGDIQDTTISSDPYPSNMVWLEPRQNNKSFRPTPDSTVSEDKSGLIWKISLNQNERPIVSTHRRVDIEDDIYHILCWNVRWLLEQKNSELSAPVNLDKQCLSVPLTFENFEHYTNVMLPLLRLELWQYIFQMTYEKEDRRMSTLNVRLEHERRAGRNMYLDCEYIPPLSPTKNMMPFRTEDFCLLEMRVKDSQNSYMYTCFGYIKSIVGPNRHNSGGKITIVTKSFDKQISRKQFVVRICANITSNLRLIRTVKSLNRSPLLQYILKPCSLANTMPIKNVSLRKTPMLNSTQKEISSQASEMALKNSPGIYIINGPPGTGKSSVIVSTVLEILYKCRASGQHHPRILLTAPSNTAIDGLILKLYQAKKELPEPDRKLIKIVRIGPDSSINELVDKFTLRFQAKKYLLMEHKLNCLPEYRKVVNNVMDIEQFLKKTLGNQYNYEYKIAEDKVLNGANLICTTLNSCISFILNQPGRKSQMTYTCCIIDEATQCNEVECLSPIQLGINKFILVGDPQQLAAVVCNKEAQQRGFGKSLFSRITENLSTNRRYQNHFPIKMLCDQYRMKPEICDYPNRTFYEGKLKSHPKCHNPIEPPLKPYMLFNLNNPEKEDESNYTNSDEVELISNLLKTLECHIKSNCEYSIGIITPYKAQKELIIKQVSKIMSSPKVKITVNTVDSFQGMENDVIIISSVRYSTNYFLANKNRLNVALTRAKQALFFIGNYNLFMQCRPLYDLREDAKRRNLLFDLKEDTNYIASLKKCIFN